MTPTFEKCDGYLEARTGTYEYRCKRYDAVINVIISHGGLDPSITVADLGAGWTEFGHRLTEKGFRGRYLPFDGAIDGKDLTFWQPPYAQIDWVVAIELLEHLQHPERLAELMFDKATKGVIITTPNSETVDTLRMDEDHVVALTQPLLEDMGFEYVDRHCLFPGNPYLYDESKDDDTLVAYRLLK